MLFQASALAPAPPAEKPKGNASPSSPALKGAVYSHEEKAKTLMSFSKSLMESESARERYSRFVIGAVSFESKFGPISSYERQFREYSESNERNLPPNVAKAASEYSALAMQAHGLSEDTLFREAIGLRISMFLRLMGSLAHDMAGRERQIQGALAKDSGLTREAAEAAAGNMAEQVAGCHSMLNMDFLARNTKKILNREFAAYLFSSKPAPAAFKEQLDLRSLPAPRDEDIAKIMSLRDGEGLNLKLDGRIYRVEMKDNKLNMYKTAADKAYEIARLISRNYSIWDTELMRKELPSQLQSIKGFKLGFSDCEKLADRLATTVSQSHVTWDTEILRRAIPRSAIGIASTVAESHEEWEIAMLGRDLPGILTRKFGIPERTSLEAANAIMGLSLAGLKYTDFEYIFRRRQAGDLPEALSIGLFRKRLRESGWFEDDLDRLLDPEKGNYRDLIKAVQLFDRYKFDRDTKVIDLDQQTARPLEIPDEEELKKYFFQNGQPSSIRKKIEDAFPIVAATCFLASQNRPFDICFPFSSGEKFKDFVALSYAIAIVESGVVKYPGMSSAGAKGMFQVMPDTLISTFALHQDLLKGDDLAPKKGDNLKTGEVRPELNVACGVLYLSDLLNLDFVAETLVARYSPGARNAIKALRQLPGRVSDLKQKRDTMELEASSLRFTIGELAGRVEKLQSEIENAGSQAAKHDMRSELKKLQKELGKARKAQSSLDARLAGIEKGIRSAERQFNEAKGRVEKLKMPYLEELEGKWDFRAAIASYNAGIPATYRAGKWFNKNGFDLGKPGSKEGFVEETQFYATTVSLLAKSLLAEKWFNDLAEKYLAEKQGKSI